MLSGKKPIIILDASKEFDGYHLCKLKQGEKPIQGVALNSPAERYPYEGKGDGRVLPDVNRFCNSKRFSIVITGEKGKGRTLTDIMQRDDFTNDEWVKYAIEAKQDEPRRFGSLDGFINFIKDYVFFNVLDEDEKTALAQTIAYNINQEGLCMLGIQGMRAHLDMQNSSLDEKASSYVVMLTPVKHGISFDVATTFFDKKHDYIAATASDEDHCLLQINTKATITVSTEEKFKPTKTGESKECFVFNDTLTKALGEYPGYKEKEEKDILSTSLLSSEIYKELCYGDPYVYLNGEEKDLSRDKPSDTTDGFQTGQLKLSIEKLQRRKTSLHDELIPPPPKKDQPPEEDQLKVGFLKKHWKKIALGIFLSALVIGGIFTFGATLAVAAGGAPFLFSEIGLFVGASAANAVPVGVSVAIGSCLLFPFIPTLVSNIGKGLRYLGRRLMQVFETLFDNRVSPPEKNSTSSQSGETYRREKSIEKQLGVSAGERQDPTKEVLQKFGSPKTTTENHVESAPALTTSPSLSPPSPGKR